MTSLGRRDVSQSGNAEEALTISNLRLSRIGIEVSDDHEGLCTIPQLVDLATGERSMATANELSLMIVSIDRVQADDSKAGSRTGAEFGVEHPLVSIDTSHARLHSAIRNDDNPARSDNRIQTCESVSCEHDLVEQCGDLPGHTFPDRGRNFLENGKYILVLSKRPQVGNGEAQGWLVAMKVPRKN